MSETTTMFDDGWVSLELDEDLYPADAVQGAAYVFLDRAYVFLDRAPVDDGGSPKPPRRLRVRLKPKDGDDDADRSGLSAAFLAGELENEALAQAYRRRIAEDQRVYIESIASRAMAGAAGPPGLDDLLAMDIGADTAFDDPLGIAMSWEDRYAKKKAPAASGEAPSPEHTPTVEEPEKPRD